MAKEFPKQTARAVHKICLEPNAVDAAEARALGWRSDAVVPELVANDSVRNVNVRRSAMSNGCMGQ